MYLLNQKNNRCHSRAPSLLQPRPRQQPFLWHIMYITLSSRATWLIAIAECSLLPTATWRQLLERLVNNDACPHRGHAHPSRYAVYYASRSSSAARSICSRVNSVARPVSARQKSINLRTPALRRAEIRPRRAELRSLYGRSERRRAEELLGRGGFEGKKRVKTVPDGTVVVGFRSASAAGVTCLISACFVYNGRRRSCLLVSASSVPLSSPFCRQRAFRRKARGSQVSYWCWWVSADAVPHRPRANRNASWDTLPISK